MKIFDKCEICEYGDSNSLGIACMLPFPEVLDCGYCRDFELKKETCVLNSVKRENKLKLCGSD